MPDTSSSSSASTAPHASTPTVVVENRASNKPSTVDEGGISSGVQQQQQQQHSALQWGIMLLVLGSSAGLTLYTKKTGSMLQGLKRLEETHLRNHPPRIGPPTKQEYEKIRPRIDKDEFF